MPNSKFASISGKIAIGLSIILVIVGVVGFFKYARFQSRVNQLRANNELMSLEDIVHHVEDPQDDALTYLSPIFETAAEINMEIPRDDMGNAKTDPESLALFDRLATTHADVFAKISLAANAPDMSLDFDDEQNQTVSVLDLQKIGILWGWKGRVLIAKGDVDGGVDTALELLRLADNIEQPFLLNLLLSNAFRVNAFDVLYEASSAGKIDSEVKKEIDLRLDELDLAESYCLALKLERSASIFYIINPELLADSQPSGIAWLTSLVPAGPAAVAGNAFLDQMETIIDRGKAPWSKQYPVDEEKEWTILSAFGGDMTGYYNRIRNRIGQVAAQGRAIRIVLALNASDEALNLEKWPAEFLMGLGVPEEMTVDPFTDLPMQVKRIDNRWMVYSLGPDKIDDDGARDSDDRGMVPRPIQ